MAPLSMDTAVLVVDIAAVTVSVATLLVRLNPPGAVMAPKLVMTLVALFNVRVPVLVKVAVKLPAVIMPVVAVWVMLAAEPR